MSRFSVAEKCAVVTGASSGLGRHFALTLAREGAAVAVAARRLDLLRDLAKEIERLGGRALPVALDVTRVASIREAVAAVETALGPISILVNNAGTVRSKPLFEHDEADWDFVVDVNLKGAWLMALEVARHMVGHDQGGSIIQIASLIGSSRISARIPEYVASKGGLVQLTKAMAAELARHRIRVNAIAPGYFETDFNRAFLASDAGARLIREIPQRRSGRLDELDGALLLLASDASSYMTGCVIAVDGGHAVAPV